MAAARPVRAMDPYAEQFWAFTQSRELRLQRCSACGKFRWPPGPTCDRCLSDDFAWSPLSGKAKWRHEFPGGGGGGLLVTAGDVLFSGDGSGNFVAFDATNGRPLWHSRIGNPSNAPQTYMVDGRQHVLIAVGDTLYAFAMY